MNDTNTTAAQPLDLDALDKLEARAKAATPGPWEYGDAYADNGSWSNFRIIGEDGVEIIGEEIGPSQKDAAFIAAANPQTVLALIAQARAAQPESATGTTGASVPTWQERARELGEAALDPKTAYQLLQDEIDALRAQLAARGQGEPVARVIEGEQIRFLANGKGSPKAGTLLYIGPPASAQPADELDHGETVLRVQEALGITRTGWVSPDVIMLRIEQLQNGSAQPDRGAVQGDERALFEAAEIDYWQSKQPKGQILTPEEKAYLLRSNTWDKSSYEACDGRWQGWQWRATLATASSPASQPVAPSDAPTRPLPRGHRADAYEPDVIVYDSARVRAIVDEAVAAVAPSDAKGKADAANAGGQAVAWRFRTKGAKHWQVTKEAEFAATMGAHGHIEIEPLGVLSATSAADAKDAARWRAFVGSSRIRPLGSAGLGEPMPGNYAHIGLEMWTAGDWGDASSTLGARLAAQTKLGAEWLTKYADIAIEARRAAMAAAPSSAAGKEGGDK